MCSLCRHHTTLSSWVVSRNGGHYYQGMIITIPRQGLKHSVSTSLGLIMWLRLESETSSHWRTEACLAHHGIVYFFGRLKRTHSAARRVSNMLKPSQIFWFESNLTLVDLSSRGYLAQKTNSFTNNWDRKTDSSQNNDLSHSNNLTRTGNPSRAHTREWTRQTS